MIAKRESPPPSRWGRSKNGIYFYLVHTTKRNHRGEKLYRAKFSHRLTSPTFWTLADLTAAGVRWLKNKPKGWGK